MKENGWYLGKFEFEILEEKYYTDETILLSGTQILSERAIE